MASGVSLKDAIPSGWIRPYLDVERSLRDRVFTAHLPARTEQVGLRPGAPRWTGHRNGASPRRNQHSHYPPKSTRPGPATLHIKRLPSTINHCREMGAIARAGGVLL